MSGRRVRKMLPDTDALRRVRALLDLREMVYDKIVARGITSQWFDTLTDISQQIQALLPATGVSAPMTDWEDRNDGKPSTWWRNR